MLKANRYLLLLYIPIHLLLYTATSSAQGSATITENSSTNYSPHYLFSTYFGSGLYNSTGKGISVFNIPITYEPEQDSKHKYRWRLPLSLGLYNFTINNAENIRFDDAATLSSTVGLEYDYWLNEKSMLQPFFDIGFSYNFGNYDKALITAAGLSYYHHYQLGDIPQLFLMRYQYAHYNTYQEHLSDSFSSLEVGTDFRFNKTQGQQWFIGAYALLSWYMLDIAYNPDTLDPKQETSAQEIGLTLGTDKPFSIIGFELKRINLGFRYSYHGQNIIRLSFNNPL